VQALSLLTFPSVLLSLFNNKEREREKSKEREREKKRESEKRKEKSRKKNTRKKETRKNRKIENSLLWLSLSLLFIFSQRNDQETKTLSITISIFHGTSSLHVHGMMDLFLRFTISTIRLHCLDCGLNV